MSDLVKPEIGSEGWGEVLNTALDTLDEKETEAGAQAKADAAAELAITTSNTYADNAAAAAQENAEDYTDSAIAALDTATSAQGALADTAVQPGDLATVATSGDAGDLTGTLPTAALPDLAITDVTVVADETAMLALDAQRGDVAVREDDSTSYILSSDDPTEVNDWKPLGGAGGGVSSVNGETGTVSLNQDDIGDGTTYKQYSATDKSKLAGLPSSVPRIYIGNSAPAAASYDIWIETA